MKHWIALLAIIPAPAADLPLTVEFNRDVRPILSDKCFACHGPDQSTRKSKLRVTHLREEIVAVEVTQ